MKKIDRLLEIMQTLRDPEQGCPWDLAQTFASIVPHTLEEAYEVADAIERGSPVDLKDELGDLLFQIVFYAQLAAEQGHFNFDDVVASINDKMIRRHPHVFADHQYVDSAQQERSWEQIKRDEKGHGGSVLADIPQNLPALSRAAKLQRRAASVGFDWQSLPPVIDKVDEEIAELKQAIEAKNKANSEQAGEQATLATAEQAVFEEYGDLLFACVNLARFLSIDAEAALRMAGKKFERRFQQMQVIAETNGQVFKELTLAEQETLWQQVKRCE